MSFFGYETQRHMPICGLSAAASGLLLAAFYIVSPATACSSVGVGLGAFIGSTIALKVTKSTDGNLNPKPFWLITLPFMIAGGAASVTVGMNFEKKSKNNIPKTSHVLNVDAYNPRPM